MKVSKIFFVFSLEKLLFYHSSLKIGVGGYFKAEKYLYYSSLNRSSNWYTSVWYVVVSSWSVVWSMSWSWSISCSVSCFDISLGMSFVALKPSWVEAKRTGASNSSIWISSLTGWYEFLIQKPVISRTQMKWKYKSRKYFFAPLRIEIENCLNN